MTDRPSNPRRNPREWARTCAAKLKRKNGGTCEALAIRGTPYCKYHGGRRLAKKRNVVRAYGMTVELKLFSRSLSSTLAARLSELANEPPEQQRSLWKELALMRELAGQSLQLYDAAQQSGKPEIIVPAASLLRDSVREVIDSCETAVKVDAMSNSVVSVAHFGAIIDQIVKSAILVFGDDPRLADFERIVREQIKLPTKEGGTTVTPTDDVLAMDSTIPRA